MDVQKLLMLTASGAPGAMSGGYAGFVGGSSTAMRITLGVALALGVIGWSLAVTRGSDIAAYEAQIAEAGLAGVAPDKLTFALAERRRELNQIESAIVSRAAALGAREQQLAKAIAAQEAAEAAAAEAVALKAAAEESVAAAATQKSGIDRTIIRGENVLVSLTAAVGAREKQLAALTAKANAQSKELDELRRFQASVAAYEAERETLKRDTVRAGNALVSLSAAVGARERQLGGLIGKVNAASDTLREVDLWRAEKDRMLAANAELAREVTRTENRLLTTAVAANARQGQVDKAIAKLAAAETEAETLNRTVLASEAKLVELGQQIVSLGAEAEEKSRAVVRVHNQLIPMISAVGAREQQVQRLISRNDALEADAMALSREIALKDARLEEMTETATVAAERLKALSEFLSTQVTPVVSQ